MSCIGRWAVPAPLARYEHRTAVEPLFSLSTRSAAGTELPVKKPCPEVWILTHVYQHHCDLHGCVAHAGDLSWSVQTLSRAAVQQEQTAESIGTCQQWALRDNVNGHRGCESNIFCHELCG